MSNLLQNKVFLAIISMLTGIVLVDFYSVIIKSLGNQYSTPQLAFFRNFFALLPVIFLLFITKDLSDIFKDISKKLLSTNNENWNTIPRTYSEIDTLRAKFEKQEDKEKLKILDDINAYVEDLEKYYSST